MDEDQTNLIINYLPQSLQDEEFRKMFENIGPLKSSKIVRDKNTGYSYGFGFVDFHNPKDAATAISQLNGYRMEHKVLKVAYSRRNEEDTKGSKLYLQKLPPQYTEEEVSNYFSSYGNIVQVRVVTDRATGQSKGIGFILFSKRSEAEAALNDLDNKVPPGGTQPLRVKFADDNAKKVKAPSQYNYYNQTPYPVHGGYGEGMGGSRGPMRNPGGRFRFNPMGNTSTYGGGYGGGSSSYGADYYSPPSQGGGYVLFVYNIGPEADEKTLWRMFSPLGTVTKVNVVMDHQKSQSKGYGFVTMPNLEEAEYAILNMNGYSYNGRELSVSFKS
ncbi:ELAV-like protein 2 isoform X1 [Crassostrea virginica]|uniref:ELAV-like protein 1 isoform X1 n=2 Tax=Crassostrea virginica TaxID=6565 RepID=A0A8B8D5Y3_CRAVI|nr:ELAV-like protein 1 isoform X1 [Crassostrea virginica]